MTELEKIQRAKIYIDKLAKGIDPITDTHVSEFDSINNQRVSSCLSYTSEILGEIIENGGIRITNKRTVPFFLTHEQRDLFNYSPEPICITEICKRINDLTDNEEMRALKYSYITSWLMSIGMLHEVKDSFNKNTKRPTKEGEALGISVDKRIVHSKTIFVVQYNIAAQMFIVDNLDAIIACDKTSK